MIKPFVVELRRRIQAEVQNQTNALASGGATSFDKYCHTTGIIYGLALAERELSDLMIAYEKE